MSLGLIVCSIALAAFMLLGIERIRTDLRDGFTSAVSGADLIVGARTGSVNLLLYAVWVSGTLGLERSDSEMGASGYSLAAQIVTKFEPGDGR